MKQNPLIIEQTKPYLYGYEETAIVVIGAGGTGGYVLQGIGRLLSHLGRGRRIQVVAIDGDMVERKNVGRQLFSHGEVGKNKAQTLTERFNRAYGLSMAYVPEMASKQRLRRLHQSLIGVYRQSKKNLIVIGCVDSGRSRSIIHEFIDEQPDKYGLWIDAGNSEDAGQVVFGTITLERHLHGVLSGPFCDGLPAPSLLYPALIQPEPEIAPAETCAIALTENRQSLNINQAVATIVCQYLSNLLIQRRIDTYETTIDLRSLSMESKAINATNLAASLNLDRSLLAEPVTQAKKKGA